MRKITLTTLGLVMALLLSACGSAENATLDPPADETPADEPVAEAEEPSEAADEKTDERAVPAEAGTTPVKVFFANSDRDGVGEQVYPLTRLVEGPRVATGALSQLLAGPTPAEQALGYGGWFSEETSGMVNAVRIEDGTAHADFTDFSAVIPNASTSAGSQVLLAQLDATLTQFPTVTDTRYSFDGDQAAFYEWLQLDVPAAAAAPPAREEDSTHLVKVYFTDAGGEEVVAVTREVRGVGVARAALNHLLAGPTAAEQEEGYGGWFSEETAGMLNTVWIDGGVAHADFADFSVVIPNASTSAGSQVLLAQLDATLTQFPTVTDTRYSFDGDQAAFYEWLQLASPREL